VPVQAPAAPTVPDLAAAAGLTVVLDPTSSPATTPVSPTAATDTAAPTELLAALPTVATGDTADSGSAGSGGPAGDPASSALTAPEPAAAVDTDTVVTASGPAPATPGTAVVEAAPAAPAGGDAPVAAQLGRQIAVLRNAPDGSQTMTVVITPESLGPVTVSVTVTQGTLDLTLHGAHEAGRHALADALPELRRELEGAGLSFSRLQVDTSSDGAGLRNAQQQLLDARAGQQGFSGQPGQQDSRARGWGSSSAPLGEGSAALTTDQSTSSGVDVRV
jgi:flagellar hook-length control protein FliK